MGFYINIDEQIPTRCLQCPMYLNMYECIWIGRDQFDKNGKMIKCPLKSNKKGQWIAIYDIYNPNISTTGKCSQCGQISQRPLGNFCKWCGAANQEIKE